MLRTAFISARSAGLRTRSLHSSPVAYKTVTEKVSEVADNVNKKVGKGLASAIETGEKAAHVTKEKAAHASNVAGAKAGEAKEKAAEASEVAGQKTNQAAAGAREAKEDFKKEVKK
ncbi:hypothetical protein FIBSPDRAFT_833234 [Athelia psychrophila]|uniref:Uncharacterized protein n=1 Tax=Athelia psychrophila TaxID=1759441 RepID=A0A166E041_9AGAM|nr:hypothetical protein FIBSPDRAFT_833234 [Fibularhizoctonia sp. CBS 109695]